MKYSVKFNGIELNDYIDVLEGFTPYVGADWKSKTRTIGESGRGSELLYQTFDEKSIKMPFVMRLNLKNKYDALEKILNVSEPKQLIFGTHPDRYYLAVPSGDLDFNQIRTRGEGEITWLVPDGLAHSTVLKEFTASTNADGILEATIVNNGTVEVPISYEITHTAENGYIGIVSENGAMQYGKIDEADGVTYKKNECLLTHTDIFNAADDVGGVDQMHPDDGDKQGTSGSLTMRTINGVQYLGFGTEGARKGTASGGLRTITIPADSEGVYGATNFYCWFRIILYAGLMGQTGEMCINWLTADNTPICGLNWYKADKSGNTGYYAIYGYTPTRTKGNGNLKCYGTYSYVCDHVSNPWDNTWGQCDLNKSGSKLTFYFMGKYPSFSIPEIADMACTKIQISIKAREGRANVGRNFLSLLGLREFYFYKQNVEKWKDVPNHYSANDIVTINGDESKVYVNSMIKQGEEVRGTEYFKAPTGESKVQFYCSDWVTAKPTCKAYIREAWL